jgi:iron(III) transport system substrate-binding protein
VKSAAPCEGHQLRDRRHRAGQGRAQQGEAEVLRLADEPEGQQIGARANSLQVPANKTFKPDPRIPVDRPCGWSSTTSRSTARPAERRRLVERWVKEVESQPR